MLSRKGEHASAVEKVLVAFLTRCSPSELLQHVVPLLSDDELLACLRHALPRCNAGTPLTAFC